MEAEFAAEDVVAKEPGCIGFLDRFLAALVDIPDLAVDIVVAALATHRVCSDRHALE